VTEAVLNFAKSLFITQLIGQHDIKPLVNKIEALLRKPTTQEAPQSPNEKLTEEQAAGGKDDSEKPYAPSVVPMAESVQQAESVISVEQGTKPKKSTTSLNDCVSESANTKEQGIKRKKSSEAASCGRSMQCTVRRKISVTLNDRDRP